MIRVAFVGKGGAGKSSIAGTFARLLAKRGGPVLAVDSDPMPGLAYSLGVAPEDQPIPDDVVVAGPASGPRWVLRDDLDADTVIERYAQQCPDGVRYLHFGNLWGPIFRLQRAQHAWSQVVAELEPDRFNLIGDLPGGTRQAMFGWAKYADTVCVVVEPTIKSLHTAIRLLRISDARWAPTNLLVVVNKAQHEADTDLVSERLGTEVSTTIPYDRATDQGDRIGSAPLDANPTGGFATAVGHLIDLVAALTPHSVSAASIHGR